MARTPRKTKNPEFLRFRPYRAFAASPEEDKGKSSLWSILFAFLAVAVAVAIAIGWWVLRA